MMRMIPGQFRTCSRRELLRAGSLSWLGLGLSGVLRGQAQGSGSTTSRPIRGVILAFCPGGPSHLETFDPKPDAPLEIRGEFDTIATAIPGVRFGEHLPRLARAVERMTLVRSMRTTSPVHELAVHRLLGGVDEVPPGTGVAASRKDQPHLGAVLAATQAAPQGVPHAVILPTNLTFEGAVFPGQNAGFLGPRFDPWHILGDPTEAGFGPEALELPEGLSIDRLNRRRSLLKTVDEARQGLDRLANSTPMDEFRRQAIAIVTSRTCREAFDLEREDPRARDRYGRTLMGQGLLLGRRLVEAGVPLVQVNLGESNVWDTHEKNFERHRDILCPPFDLAVSALVEDLDARGLSDEVLVIVTGEFGRTPRIGQPIKGGAGAKPDGRDHWPSVFSSLAFGAGVGRGQVLGASDRLASFPTTESFTPADLGATILEALGIDPTIEIHDPLGRPLPINRGRPIPWS
ncbi:DUF1501 domain-containing protein [Tautonia rosea]|uniref:DUF1501 domain-containing protein n=1 Tax=Tautonia rosea TaxID=2728037 RepID=UPI0014757C5B|nr:DUF1501 domain-containing protein [Tautonia rosea]